MFESVFCNHCDNRVPCSLIDPQIRLCSLCLKISPVERAELRENDAWQDGWKRFSRHKWPDLTHATPKFQAIVKFAEVTAQRFNHYETRPEHLALAIINDQMRPSLAATALETCVNLRMMRLEIEKRMTSHLCLKSTGGSPPDPQTLEILSRANEISIELNEVPKGDRRSGIAGLMMSLATHPHTVAHEALTDACKLDTKALRTATVALIASDRSNEMEL